MIDGTELTATENCHLIVKKIAQKLDIFFKKIAIGNFIEKMKFLAIFLHSNGNFPEGQVEMHRPTNPN